MTTEDLPIGAATNQLMHEWDTTLENDGQSWPPELTLCGVLMLCGALMAACLSLSLIELWGKQHGKARVLGNLPHADCGFTVSPDIHVMSYCHCDVKKGARKRLFSPARRNRLWWESSYSYPLPLPLLVFPPLTGSGHEASQPPGPCTRSASVFYKSQLVVFCH